MTTSQAIEPLTTSSRLSGGGDALIGVFLTERDLAARWHINAGSLANARSAGRSPVPYTKVLGRILYALADVEAVEHRGAVAA